MVPIAPVLDRIQETVDATLPISDFSLEYAEHSIQSSQVIKYVVFFGSVFIVAYLTCRVGFGLKAKTATLLGTCTCSALHGIVCILGGVEILYYGHFWQDRRLDHENTELQNQMMRYSLAYLLFDTIFSISDPLFLAHHILSILYLIAVLQIQIGATSATFVFFLGEVTSPIFNSFAALKELRKEYQYPWVIRTFAIVSPLFTLSFILVRSVISVPLVFWFVNQLLWDSHAIPLFYRLGMIGLVAMGLLGSQVWSYKLFQGYLKQRGKLKTR